MNISSVSFMRGNHPRQLAKVLLCLFVLQAWYVPLSIAGPYKNRFSSGESYSLEQFSRIEFDAQGEKLRQENGQRVAIGLIEDNIDWAHPGVIYETKLEGLLGIVFYEDNAPTSSGSSGAHLSSKSDYYGGSIETMIGQRYGYLTGRHMLEAMAGFEVEAWLHNIRTGDGSMLFSQGTQELYGFGNVKLALGVVNWWGSMRQRIQAGIRYPVIGRIASVTDKALVTPGREYSWFGFFELGNLATVGKQHINMRLYFDSYRMGAVNSSNGFYKDASEQLSFGVNLVFH